MGGGARADAAAVHGGLAWGSAGVSPRDAGRRCILLGSPSLPPVAEKLLPSRRAEKEALTSVWSGLLVSS